MAARYEASRSVLREAIKVLNAKGLVTARPRAGTFVTPPSEWNLFDPDVLRWTPLHASINSAWRAAAEDAADDAATRGREEARVDLAALLVKIARLAPSIASPSPVSPFADEEGLNRRVHRLLTPTEQQLAASWPLLIPAVWTTTALAVVVAVTSPSTLKQLYEFVELVVAFGR